MAVSVSTFYMVDSICALKLCATPYRKQTNCRPTNPKVHIHLLTYYLPKQLPSSPLPLLTPSSNTATVFITTSPKGLSDHVPGYAHFPPDPDLLFTTAAHEVRRVGVLTCGSCHLERSAQHIRTVADPVKFRKLLKSLYFTQAFNICWLLCFCLCFSIWRTSVMHLWPRFS